MRKGKQSQVQRIAALEESVAKIYMLVQSIVIKITEDETKENKEDE